MGEWLDVVAPPSLVCWNLAHCARNPRYGLELDQILDFYAAEIRDSGRARLFFVRARQLIEDKNDDRSLFGGTDPLAARDKGHIIEELRRHILLSHPVDHRFDPQMFLAIAESGHLDLSADLPERLETLIDPYMHPAVLMKLIDQMQGRDGDINLLGAIEPIIRKLWLEEKAWLDRGIKWSGSPGQAAMSPEEERIKRRHYNLIAMFGLLRLVICKINPEEAARLDASGTGFGTPWSDPFGLKGLIIPLVA
jgi:hypothetical protein